jgi:hypothetical protein
MITIQVHILNQDPFKLDVEELPKMTDYAIIGSNPRDRTEKEVQWIEDGVATVIIPWTRINYIQVLPDQGATEDFPLFYRQE